MCVITILNANRRPVDVEVSVDIYRVYEESRKQEERQRYERRKHIDGRAFHNCLLFELATEPLEETFERLETLQEINSLIEQLPTASTPEVCSTFYLRLFLFRDSRNAGLS